MPVIIGRPPAEHGQGRTRRAAAASKSLHGVLAIKTRLLVIPALLLAAGAALAQGSATHRLRVLTPEAALKATQAALLNCRSQGYEVAVAVVDRFGVAQALLRDRFAGAHTPDTAVNKAWTAASFRTGALELATVTQPGQPGSRIRHLPRFVGVGGGVLIEAGGSIVGAIGVWGAAS
jgi:uncharacterized protein GlcG (DUF336 family)